MFCLLQRMWAFTTFRAGQRQKFLLVLADTLTVYLTRQLYCQSWKLMCPDDSLPQGSLGRALALA